jgi:chloramphenicol-sensitive protein RarD
VLNVAAAPAGQTMPVGENVAFLAAHKKTPASAGVNRFWHSEGRPEPERRCEKSDA